MKRFLLSAALCLGLLAPTFAQVNVVPQVGVASGVINRNTYSAVTLSLPPASTATDIACIAGSATKNIYIDRLRITGTAGTLVTAEFTLLRRASADTGGTPATTTANWANTIAKNDTNNPANSATLVSYSANPTIGDSSPTYVRSQWTTLPVTTAGTSINPIDWSWDDREFSQRPTLRGVAQQLCVNLNSISVSSGVLDLYIQWTEE